MTTWLSKRSYQQSILFPVILQEIESGAVMDTNQFSPASPSFAELNMSVGVSSGVEFFSFSSSLDRSRGVEDVTLQQLATAKETFGDLEAAYRNFKHEMEMIKEEHSCEVNFQSSVC